MLIWCFNIVPGLCERISRQTARLVGGGSHQYPRVKTNNFFRTRSVSVTIIWAGKKSKNEKWPNACSVKLKIEVKFKCCYSQEVSKTIFSKQWSWDMVWWFQIRLLLSNQHQELLWRCWVHWWGGDTRVPSKERITENQCWARSETKVSTNRSSDWLQVNTSIPKIS